MTSSTPPPFHSTRPAETSSLEVSARSEPPSEGGLVAWLQVLGSWIMLAMTWGLVNSFGVFQTYYERDLLRDTSTSSVSWIGSLQGALLLLLAPLSGMLYDAGYFRELLWGGIFIILLGVFTTSVASSYWQILLAQGIGVGLGCGLTYVPCTAILAQYFSHRRALVIGLSSTGSPIAGIIFPLLFDRLQPRIGFGWATRCIGFILLGLAVIPIACLRVKSAPARRLRTVIDTSALRRPDFCLLICGSFFSFLTLYLPFFYTQLFAVQKRIGDVSASSIFIILLNVGSIPGRILPNYLAGRFGPWTTQITVACMCTLLMFIWLTVDTSGGLSAFAVFYGFSSGAVVSVLPALIVSLSPDLDKVGTRMGMVFFISGVALAIGIPIAGAVLGDKNNPQWQYMLIYAGTALFLGLILYSLGGLKALKLKKKT